MNKVLLHQTTLPTSDITLTKDDVLSINKIAKTDVESDFQQINGIYIDLDTFRDMWLGALIDLVSEDEYPIILNNIDKYNERIADVNRCSIFPGISITEDQILKYLNSNVEKLLVTSPTTTLASSLGDLIKNITFKNITKDKIRIAINFYPYQPSKQVLSYYNSFITSLHPAVVFSSITKAPLADIKPSDISNGSIPLFNTFFLSSIYSFISEDSLHYSDFIEKLKYFNSSVFFPRKVDPTIKGSTSLSKEELNKSFTTLEAALGLFTKVKIMNFTISSST